MRHQLRKVKHHVGACIGLAERLRIDVNAQGAVHAALMPVGAEFIGCDGHRAEGGGRFGLEEAKALGQFPGNQVAQRHVIDQHQQSNGRGALRRGGPHAHVAGNNRYLGFQINAPVFRQGEDRVAWAHKGI